MQCPDNRQHKECNFPLSAEFLSMKTFEGEGGGWPWVEDESISALSMSRLSVRFITLRNASSTPEKFTLARARNRSRANACPNKSQFYHQETWQS